MCADELASGAADIGIVPVVEMARQKLEWFRDVGICALGPVRSILLISKLPFDQIRTLATDSGSRTSVMLARMILAEQFGVEPEVVSHPPVLEQMLQNADAALVIGDAALRIEPEQLPYATLDLGQAWTSLTNLPMVFAVWAGRKEIMIPEFAAALEASSKYGMAHMNDIVVHEAKARNFSEAVVRQYLTHYIKFDLNEDCYKAIDIYLKKSALFEPTLV